MRTKITFFLVVFITTLFTCKPAFAHKEWVHQYLVKQSYKFLESRIGTVQVMKDAVGLNHHGPGSGSQPFDNPYPIGVGAWREDIEDAGYGNVFQNIATVSVTHFWNADGGDNAKTNIPGIGQVDNAWEKAQRYLFGTDRIYVSGKWLFNNQYAIQLEITYSSLVEFYKGVVF